ncbi:MAG: succinate dehydrogenase, cytochrome b556 subunit [Candidatus Puniceispirillaceae bacterium]|jgi:succinate dehydrogenase / fumarate reductase cytochrome b subunit
MARPRPLSPHLQVYRPQLTSMMSITHRATGVALTTGTLVLAAWLVALALGGETYTMAAMAVAHPLGQFVLFGYSAALIYHALNGIRHLSWDLGRGLTIPDVYRSGHIVLFLTFLLTACLWLAILA